MVRWFQVAKSVLKKIQWGDGIEKDWCSLSPWVVEKGSRRRWQLNAGRSEPGELVMLHVPPCMLQASLPWPPSQMASDGAGPRDTPGRRRESWGTVSPTHSLLRAWAFADWWSPWPSTAATPMRWPFLHSPAPSPCPTGLTGSQGFALLLLPRFLTISGCFLLPA